MKPKTKLRGSPAGSTLSELTRFKELWCTLSEPQRAYWRGEFASSTPTAQTRENLQVKLGITLTDDNQVGRFRKWDAQEEAREEAAQQMVADEQFFLPAIEQEVRGEMAGRPEAEILAAISERLRVKVLNAAKHRALATGDFALGLSAVRVDQAEQTGKFTAQLEMARLGLQKQAEARAQQEFLLALEKFQFDAAKKSLEAVKELKTISASKLTDVEKIDAARKALFGELPEAQEAQS